MIRLGSLAGYAFSGPRLLAGWDPPAEPGVYAILYKPEPERERYAVVYVGHADDLTSEGLPLRHPRAHCWTQRAGGKWRLHVATLSIPGGTKGHREMVAEELISMYTPHCNAERYEGAWREEWIGTDKPL
ncbi:MAG: hypothetical protein J0I34_02485 [Pseudonocardia sp.]|uniref:hypothetical protein n=1 Tax=unclassified Pseudonocardia TaxID=2619320 RepID=UPI000868BEDB|nr:MULTISPECIES: hypothetical protein [unclassified Pseudonocardia]MBN9107625.1 hypothetical protein [Pseudonocardia sp.]ODV08471.1 MAG: hypothetical protein ABT15_04200 [Pseudonocardia sp. SCN 73-27]